MKQKKKEVEFLGMLLGTIGASLSGNSLGSKRVKAKIPEKGVMRAGERTIRAGEGRLMSLNVLTNFEIQKYYQNQPKFNGVYLRNNLAKIKDVAYVINLDECKSVGTIWIA